MGWEAESGFALVEGISDETKLIGWCEAQRLTKIAQLYAVGEMHPLPPPAAATAAAGRAALICGLTREELTVREIAARLCLSEYVARRLVRLALALTTRFTGTLAALACGQIDLRRAEIIEEHAGPLAEDHYQAARASRMSPAEAEAAAVRIAAMVEALVLAKASTQSPAELHPAVRRAVHRADPEFTDRQTRRELKGRQVTHRTNPTEGTGDLWAHLGAAEAQGVFNVIDAYARAARQGGSERNLNELRADALTHLVLYGHMPDPGAVLNPAPVDTTTATLIPETDPHTGDIRRTDTSTETASTEPATSTPGTSTPGTSSADTTSTDAASPEAATSSPGTDDVTSTPDTSAPTDTEARSGTRTQDTTSTGPRTAESTDPGTGESTDPGTGESTGPGTATAAGPDTHPTRHDPDHLDDLDTAGTGIASDPGQPTSSQGDPPGDPDPDPRTPPDPNPVTHPRSAGATRSGLRAHVHVVVTLDTLLGLNDEPADLTGHGPISAHTARDLAFNTGSTWRRLVTDPITGYLLDHSRKTYRPPAALADHVRARDRTCRTPNCTRPAAKCDLDHVISWPAGTTSETNLATECDRDHRYKHEGHWRHQVSTDPAHPPGTIIMISPTGHVYLSHPHNYTDPPLKPSPPQPETPGGKSGSPSGAAADDPGPPPF